VDNTEEFRGISLCSGYAGLEMGVKRAVPALRTVCYVEIEAFACANLVSKIEAGLLDAAPIWTDIKTFDGRPFRNRVHIITAGYPCQGESVAGKRLKERDPRWLWPHIERIIEAVKPVWCFFENVSGHLSGGYPTVYRGLRNLGYKVEAGLFTAAEIGAPHKRERVYVLARAISYGRCGILRQAGQGQDGPQQRKDLNRQGVGDGRERAPCELANTKCSEQGQGTIKETQAEIRRDRFAIEGMGNTKHAGPQRTGPGISAGVGEFAWPAPPGWPQYEWEEPRVVAYNKRKRCRGRTQETTESDNKDKQNNRDKVGRKTDGCRSVPTSKGHVKSRLGRAVNGTNCRVDRLRLLGNGVVPQQAELAFRVLTSTFASKEKAAKRTNRKE